MLPNPSRSGYTFNGWYDAASGGNRIGGSGASYTPTGNITLYAQWTVTVSGGGIALSTNLTRIMQGSSQFVIKGVNIESYRDSNDGGLNARQWAEFPSLVSKFTSLGINAVRMCYSPGFVNSGSNFANYCSMMSQFASVGIYFMPCDISYTGYAITGYTTKSYPTFQAIINYCRSNGILNYLIMNPYNEPWGNVAADENAWVAANEATVNFFRTTCGFGGLVVLDTTDWATTNVASSMDSLLGYDASLLGGKANICFSNHWYYNQGTTNYLRMLGTTCKTYPYLVGEAGPAYPGKTTTDEGWYTTLMDYIVSTGNPNGNNGFFPWIWWWTDNNEMTNDGLNLNAVGNDVVSHYYSKV